MSVDNKGFAMFGSYYTAGVGDLNVLFGSWGLLSDYAGSISGGGVSYNFMMNILVM